MRGYKDLNIDLFMSPSTLRPYASITYSKKAENHDDIIATLSKHFGEDGTSKLIFNTILFQL